MKPNYPGWKMSESQHGAYFRLFAAACEAQKCRTAKEKEDLRQAAHHAAFGRFGVSAKDIDQGKMFDAIKREFLRLADRVDHNADQARVRLLHEAEHMLEVLRDITSAAYIAKLLKQRFKIIPGKRTVEDLSNGQLSQLIITCNSRIKVLSQSKISEVEVEESEVYHEPESANVPF